MTPAQRAAAERLADELAAVHPLHPYVRMCGSAAALLRAALAEPMRCPEDGGLCGAGGYCRPEPQGEPVARIHVWSKISRFTGQPECHAEVVDFEDGVDKLPEGEHVLYAHQQRQPLTEGEINAMIRELGFGALTASLVVRATERKHGIGEKT